METDTATLLQQLEALLSQEKYAANQRLAEGLASLFAELTGRGIYYSSINIERVMQLYEQDIEARTRSLLSTVAELLAGLGHTGRRALAPQAKPLATAWIATHIDDLQAKLIDHAKRLRYTQRDSLDLGKERVLNALEVRLDLLLVRPSSPVTGDAFVDPERLNQLRTLMSEDFDLQRLIRLCEELNLCFQNGCYHAVAMLTRAMLDHIPPLFGYGTFREVAASYAGGRSFKELAESLERSARKIADGYLHIPIRQKETLPTLAQVDVRNQLDTILAESIRHMLNSEATDPLRASKRECPPDSEHR